MACVKRRWVRQLWCWLRWHPQERVIAINDYEAWVYRVCHTCHTTFFETPYRLQVAGRSRWGGATLHHEGDEC
jgi:hypothetical protein